MNTINTIWLLSNAVFILLELIAGTLEKQLWIFAVYILIHLSLLSIMAIKSPLFSSNVGYKIIALAVIIPLFFGISQVYLLLNQYDLRVIIGLGITGAATSYSLVALGFMTMMLVIERDRYAMQAHSDALTGLNNRRGLYNHLEYVVAECERNSESLSAVVCDIDFFKKINDSYGHDAGDVVLKHFAELLKKAVRGGDIVARLGGEEFVICLPKSDMSKSRQFAERTRKLIENMEVATKNRKIKLTASFGVASQHTNIDTDLLIKAADKALYEAKARGRNQVCSANEDS
jgi:diguanylate cyclase (GGDEF)-like protein